MEMLLQAPFSMTVKLVAWPDCIWQKRQVHLVVAEVQQPNYRVEKGEGRGAMQLMAWLNSICLVTLT